MPPRLSTNCQPAAKPFDCEAQHILKWNARACVKPNTPNEIVCKQECQTSYVLSYSSGHQKHVSTLPVLVIYDIHRARRNCRIDQFIPSVGRYTGISSLRSPTFHAALQLAAALTWSCRVSRC